MKIMNVEDGSGDGNNEGTIMMILYYLLTPSILKFTDILSIMLIKTNLKYYRCLIML